MTTFFVTLLALLLLTFTLQNVQEVSINFLYWGFDSIPLALTVITCIIVGIIIGILVILPKIWKRNSNIKALNKKVVELEKLIVLKNKTETNNSHNFNDEVIINDSTNNFFSEP